jgi:uncharacterized protein YggE
VVVAVGRRASGIVAVAGALVVALAVVTAYALGTAGRTPASASSPPADRPEPTMTTSGQGSATGIPDEMSFGIAVTETQADVGTALARTSARMHAVLKALGSLGVRPRDMQTTGLHVGPHYSYTDGSAQLTGYTVTQRARITVRDIARGGKAIGVAAGAGRNDVRIGAVRLEIGNREALLEQARQAAVRDAMAKARQYAAASGQHVGAMLSLVEVRTAAPRPQRVPFARNMAGLDAAKVPLRVGRQGLDVRVKVVWSLDPTGGVATD